MVCRAAAGMRPECKGECRIPTAQIEQQESSIPSNRSHEVIKDLTLVETRRNDEFWVILAMALNSF